MGFSITEQKGFHITFPNGWTVSVQFGRGNYCDNYSHEDRTVPVPDSSDAEIAAWPDTGGKWLNFEGGDTVLGYQSPEQVLAFMNRVASFEKALT